MKRKAVRTIGVLLNLVVLSGATWAADDTVGIVLRDSSTASGNRVKLNEVVILRASAELIERVGDIDLGASPRVGAVKVITREQVQRGIQSHIGRGVKLRWQGPASVRVGRATTTVRWNDVVAGASTMLSRQLSQDFPNAARVVIVTDARQSGKDIVVPTGKLVVQPRLSRGAVGNRQVCVWNDVTVDGKPVQTVPAWFTVSVYQTVIETQRSLTPRDRLSKDDLVLVERDVVGVRGVAIGDMKKLEQMRLRWAVGAQRILTQADLELQPPVMFNQSVAVKVVAGSVQLETHGIANEEGRMGDVIRVRNPTSDKLYQAQVVGDGRVAVNLR